MKFFLPYPHFPPWKREQKEEFPVLALRAHLTLSSRSAHACPVLLECTDANMGLLQPFKKEIEKL